MEQSGGRPDDHLELVRIASNFRLFDGDSYQHRYTRAGDVPLAPGIYAVFWPRTIKRRRFDESAVYFGPYETMERGRRALAELGGKPPAQGQRPDPDDSTACADVGPVGRVARAGAIQISPIAAIPASQPAR